MTVSGLPLALTLIVGYIQGVDEDFELSDFYEEYLGKENNFEVWASGEGISMSQYSKNLLTVFSMAVGKLPKDAREVLELLSFLSPDAVPELMLTQSFMAKWSK